MRKCYNWLIFAFVGILVVVGSFAFNLWILPMLIKYQVGKTMALNENTEAWDRFLELPFPIYFGVYFFNVANPIGMLRGEKPVVQEVGPYIYSLPSLLDILDELLDDALREMLGDNNGPFLNTTVKEVLFQGHKIKCNKKKLKTLSAKIICSALKNFPGIKIFEKTKEGDIKAAILKFKNNTYNGLFEVNRGRDDFSQIGKIIKWEGKTTLDNWGSEKCNQVVGNDESLLPPFVTPETSLSVFNTDICTSIKLKYQGETTYAGINGYKFQVDPQFLGQITDYPENYCYCPQPIQKITKGNGCLYKGVMDASSCMNMPAIISFPHLYKASEKYQGLVEGLNPQEKLHETYISVEPTTGVPLSGCKRIQLNVQTKKSNSIKILKNQTTTIFPVLWFEEKAELGEAQISMIRDQLLKVLNIANIVKWVLVGVGLVIAIIGIAMAILRVKTDHHHDD